MSVRRLEILRAIVDEYVATQEPVGSKSIAARSGLGISPATIRNEMDHLEEEVLGHQKFYSLQKCYGVPRPCIL